MATVEVKCRVCNQMDYVTKHGKGSMEHQRYRCHQCNKTFQLDYIYRACRPGIKEQIVDLAMNNAGIRDTARALHISINAVVRVLKNYPHAVSQPCNSLNHYRLRAGRLMVGTGSALEFKLKLIPI